MGPGIVRADCSKEQVLNLDLVAFTLVRAPDRALHLLALRAMATQTRAEAKLSRTRSVSAPRVREHTEELEAATLSEHATRSTNTRRDRPDDPSATRAPVPLHRHRIVHSHAFRRLDHNTHLHL